jgi:hypothetical protein
VLGQAAALAALEDTDHVRRTVELNRYERERVARGLRERGLVVLPSLANFLFVDVRRDAAAVYRDLVAQGVIVRPLRAYGFDTALRVSIGAPEENTRLFQALDAVLAPGAAALSGRPPARPRGLVIAIDGPSGAGKSTAGRLLAARLGYVFLDTGAMYRTLAFQALRRGVALDDAEALAALARGARIDLAPRGEGVSLDGEDVTAAIRTREVSAAASRVSVHREVRREMVARQREMGRAGGVVLDGATSARPSFRTRT